MDMTGAISLAISSNYATNNLAFDKHFELTLVELNISVFFIYNHLLGNAKMGVPNNKDTHRAFHNLVISIILLKLKALRNLLNDLGRDVALVVITFLEEDAKITWLLLNLHDIVLERQIGKFLHYIIWI